MNLLKREVPVRKPDPSRLALFGAIPLAASALFFCGYVLGHDDGFDAAATVALGSSARHDRVVPEAACGVTDPLACAVAIAESALDLFRPVPAFTVTVTPTVAVDCAEAERAYWACANDAACPLETFEKIADDVNFCQDPSRR